MYSLFLFDKVDVMAVALFFLSFKYRLLVCLSHLYSLVAYPFKIIYVTPLFVFFYAYLPTSNNHVTKYEIRM